MSGEPLSSAKKPKNKQERLGQVWTPQILALRMVKSLRLCNSNGQLSILDPCFGPGTFYKALCEVVDISTINMTAYEIDPEILEKFDGVELKTADNFKIIIGDYLEFKCPEKYDYAILNPPYIRQEWIPNKNEIRRKFKQDYEIEVPGTSNLYVYFLVKVIMELKQKGRFTSIVYDSWQSTLYGQWLLEFVNCYCTNIAVESITDLPFDGRLIDATIISGEKAPREKKMLNKDRLAENTSNANFYNLTSEMKGLKTVEDLFWTKRGLRLKQADFFMTNLDSMKNLGATPFIKKVGQVKGYCVEAKHPEAALLINENTGNYKTYNELEKRIKEALLNPDKNTSILNWYNQRPNKWFEHKSIRKAPIIFNYYIRNRPKFIYNPSRMYSDNFYGLIPLEEIDVNAWIAVLNSTFSIIGILEQARNQGAGLAKLQLFEFRRAKVQDITEWDKRDIRNLSKLGKELISQPSNSMAIIKKIDALIQSVMSYEINSQRVIKRLLETVEKRAKNPKQFV